MTVQEILDKYLDLFVLIMESAGEKTDNEYYKNVKQILDNHKSVVDDMIEKTPIIPFELVVVMYISFLVEEIHGADRLANSDDEEIDNYINSMWNLYLKKPTRRFTAKYGLEPIDDLTIHYRIIKTNYGNKK